MERVVKWKYGFKRKTIVTLAGEFEQDSFSYIVDKIGEAAKQAISKNKDGLFRIGLSGGLMAHRLSKYLVKLDGITAWDKWRIFFCEERLLLDTDETHKTNAELYKEDFKKFKIPIPEEHIICLPKRVTNSSDESAIECCIKYSMLLRQYFDSKNLSWNGFPRFDCLLMNVRPDGSTCNLFKDNIKNTHKMMEYWVTWHKERAESVYRIGLSLASFNSANMCIFLLNGSCKSDIVKKVLNDKNTDLPIAKVCPIYGPIYWVLDKKAAGETELEKIKGVTFKKVNFPIRKSIHI